MKKAHPLSVSLLFIIKHYKSGQPLLIRKMVTVDMCIVCLHVSIIVLQKYIKNIISQLFVPKKPVSEKKGLPLRQHTVSL